MKKIIGEILLLFVAVFIYVTFFGGWKNIPGFEFLGKPEERMSCAEEVDNLTTSQTNSSKTLQLSSIKMNKVYYPLNRKDVMLEYCVTVDNFSSNLGNVGLKVQFLDKDKNVLTETDDNILDIPGRRSKTIYGSTFVSTRVAKDVASVQVSGVKWLP